MSENKYTIREVMEMTAQNLSAISVPVWLKEQITVPIELAIGNINACLEAINKQEEQASRDAARRGNLFDAEEKDGGMTDVPAEGQDDH